MQICRFYLNLNIHFMEKCVRFSFRVNYFYAILIDIPGKLYPRRVYKLIFVDNQYFQHLKFMSLKFCVTLVPYKLYNQLTVLFNIFIGYSHFKVWACVVCVCVFGKNFWKIYFQHIFPIKNSSIAHKIGLIHKIQ